MTFLKGNKPWNMGKKTPLKIRNKMSLSLKGLNSKENHPQWKGGRGTDKSYLRQYGIEKNKKLRLATLEALGGICVRCGFNDKRALQIDHINGGGSKERKERPYSGQFNKVVLKSFLKGENKYQLLCANCNWIKRCDNKEARGRIASFYK